MESLIQIVNKLKQPELRMLKSYYQIKQNKEPSKKLDLLILIKGKKVIEDKEAMRILYGDTDSSSAFSHLKERLKTDLLNTILFLNPEKMYQTRFLKKKLECRKSIIQAELLLNRSDKRIANNILAKALSTAQEFEFPDLEIQIRDIMRSERSFEGGFEAFKTHNKRIKECLRLHELILKAREYYHYIHNSNEEFLGKYSLYVEYAEKAIVDIEKDIKDNSSIRVKYWYYLISVPYYIGFKKNYTRGISLQKDFINLIKNNVAIKSKAGIAGTSMQLAHIQLHIRNYKEALPPALDSVNNFRKDSFNYLRALEILFWVYLRNHDLDNAEKTIEKAFKHKNIQKVAYFNAKWNYLKANLMFLKGDLSSAHDCLLQSDELTKDKTGWYIGFKLLLIYITFEQKNFYWLESQLENFRKLLLRNKHKLGNLKRAKTIHKVAHTLLKNHGDFSKVKKINQKELNLLKDAKDEMHWDPTGYEVVRFDDWFDNKIQLN